MSLQEVAEILPTQMLGFFPQPNLHLSLIWSLKTRPTPSAVRRK
ncbi:hypothetical protein NIES2100_07220 [Calothrix sp. NIES-2100]|nr:hypothetical protein NIES2100_07220 [Calothrix sp. NIES-2100]